MNKNLSTALHAVLRAFLAISLSVVVGACSSSDNRTDVEHLTAARDLHAKKDDKAAVVEIRNALQKNPKNVDARILLADIYLDAGGGKQAQTEIEIARQRGASPESTKIQLARAYLMQFNFDQAAKEAQVTLATPPEAQAALMEVEARARVGMRQYAAACKLFDAARVADPKFVKAYWGRTTCASARGEYDNAFEIINQAIRLDPNEPASWVILGDLNRTRGKADEALKAYDKAIELKKNNLDALLGHALVNAQARKLDAAEEDLKKVDAFSKGNPLATFIYGTVRFRQGRYPEAKTAFETSLTAAPEYSSSILWLGMTNYVQGNLEAAAKQLNQYVALVPDAQSVRALLALTRARIGGSKQAVVDLGELGKRRIDDPETLTLIGEAHTVLGDPSKGVEFLAKAAGLQPDAIAPRVRLANSLIEKNDLKGATAELRAILEKKPDDAPAMQLLINALVRQKDYAGAMSVAQTFGKRYPNDPVADNYQASIQLLMGDKGAARASFQRALDKNPNFFPASNNLALMAIEEKDLARAKTIYEGVLQKDPKSLPALMGLYSVERSLGHGPEAEKALITAAAAWPDQALPVELLGQIYNSSSRPRRALDVTDAVARAHPDGPGLLEVRGVAYLQLNEPASAIIQFTRLVQVKGDSADAYLYLSGAQALAGDRTAAKASLATALKIDPRRYETRLAVARFALSDGRADEALATARALTKDRPNDPSGVLLEAAAYGATKRSKDELGLLQATVARFPKSTDARLALIRAQTAGGDASAMLQTIRDWRKADPSNPVAAASLAEASLRTSDEAAAIDAYREQLKLEPLSTRALNNLAFLLRTRAPDEALALAKQATQLDPGNANLLDTLGQIQSARKDPKEALATLRKANELDPKNPRIRLHLAQALAAGGDSALARRELERLLAASKGFDGEADARALLASIPKT